MNKLKYLYRDGYLCFMDNLDDVVGDITKIEISGVAFDVKTEQYSELKRGTMPHQVYSTKSNDYFIEVRSQVGMVKVKLRDLVEGGKGINLIHYKIKKVIS